MQIFNLGKTIYNILKNPPGNEALDSYKSLAAANESPTSRIGLNSNLWAWVKEKNGTVSTLELDKVKGNEAVLLMAENGTKRVRNNLPKLELHIRIKERMQ
jgi:hypothetical protein